jgi:hypothetical protein
MSKKMVVKVFHIKNWFNKEKNGTRKNKNKVLTLASTDIYVSVFCISRTLCAATSFFVYLLRCTSFYVRSTFILNLLRNSMYNT